MDTKITKDLSTSGDVGHGGFTLSDLISWISGSWAVPLAVVPVMGHSRWRFFAFIVGVAGEADCLGPGTSSCSDHSWSERFLERGAGLEHHTSSFYIPRHLHW